MKPEPDYTWGSVGSPTMEDLATYEERKRKRIERDMPRDLIKELVHWLENEAKERFGGGGVHTLHLRDWEVDALLEELRRRVELGNS